MAIEFMTRVFKLEMRALEKLVLLKYADHADEKGECWPSRGTIAAHCGCSKETVRNYIRVWKKSGVIEVRNQGGGRRRTTRIRLDLDQAERVYGRVGETLDDGADEADDEGPGEEIGVPCAGGGDAKQGNQDTPFSGEKGVPDTPFSHKQGNQDTRFSDGKGVPDTPFSEKQGKSEAKTGQPGYPLTIKEPSKKPGAGAREASRPQGSASHPPRPDEAGEARGGGEDGRADKAEPVSMSQRMRDQVAEWRKGRVHVRLAEALDNPGERYCLLAWDRDRLVLAATTEGQAKFLGNHCRAIERALGLPDWGCSVELVERAAWAARGRELAAEADLTAGYDAEAFAAAWGELVAPFLAEPENEAAAAWLSDIEVLWLDGERAVIACPTRFCADHLARHHAAALGRYLGLEILIEAPPVNVRRTRGLALARQFAARPDQPAGEASARDDRPARGARHAQG